VVTALFMMQVARRRSLVTAVGVHRLPRRPRTTPRRGSPPTGGGSSPVTSPPATRRRVQLLFPRRPDHHAPLPDRPIGGDRERVARSPDVAEAAVIGGPDPLRAEVVEAFVVPRAGVTPSDTLAAPATHATRGSPQSRMAWFCSR
jgi:hypothetical protein